MTLQFWRQLCLQFGVTQTWFFHSTSHYIVLCIALSNPNPHCLTRSYRHSALFQSRSTDLKSSARKQDAHSQQRHEKSQDGATYPASPRKPAARPGREPRTPGQHAAAQSTGAAAASRDPPPWLPRTSRPNCCWRWGRVRQRTAFSTASTRFIPGASPSCAWNKAGVLWEKTARQRTVKHRQMVTRKGWGSWACSAWRREGWEGTL